ncbi:hypothetical protein HK101_008481 [Irineochytrium annulatum]|nr:hypothetical protein HK101_008481 [Irineochytrium annulatum]
MAASVWPSEGLYAAQFRPCVAAVPTSHPSCPSDCERACWTILTISDDSVTGTVRGAFSPNAPLPTGCTCDPSVVATGHNDSSTIVYNGSDPETAGGGKSIDLTFDLTTSSIKASYHANLVVSSPGATPYNWDYTRSTGGPLIPPSTASGGTPAVTASSGGGGGASTSIAGASSSVTSGGATTTTTTGLPTLGAPSGAGSSVTMSTTAPSSVKNGGNRKGGKASFASACLVGMLAFGMAMIA